MTPSQERELVAFFREHVVQCVQIYRGLKREEGTRTWPQYFLLHQIKLYFVHKCVCCGTRGLEKKWIYPLEKPRAPVLHGIHESVEVIMQY